MSKIKHISISLKTFKALFLIITVFSFLALTSCTENPGLNIKESIVSVITYDETEEVVSEGVGVIIRADGLVAVNYHVAGGSSAIKVFMGERELQVQGVVREDRERDMIVLKVNAKDLPAASLGEVSELRSGDEVFIVKNDQRELLEANIKWIKELAPGRKALLVNAPLLLEESGSPVINASGNVVAFTSLLFEEEEDPVFAFAADELKRTLPGISLDKVSNIGREDYSETAEYWMNTGFFLTESGFHDDAVKAFKEALALRPDDAAVYNQLGIVYGRMIRYDDEIEAYKKALQIKPDYAEPYNNMGIVHGLYGRTEEAVAAYKKAIEVDPGYATAYSNLGAVYGERGEHMKAMESFKKAVSLDPQDSLAHFNLGVSYGSLGLNKEVVREYEKAVRLNPDFVQARYNLAAAYLNVGKPDRAYREYNEIKDSNPELASGLFNLIDREWTRLKKAGKTP